MSNDTGTMRFGHARAMAVVLLALISALLFVILASDGRSASAQEPPPAPIARAWGNNSFGQLGDDSTSLRTRQVPVDTVDGALTGTLTNVTSMEGGQNHSLALKADGTVYAWGHNGSGQLGNGASGTDSDTPVQVEDPDDPTGFLTGVIDVAAGGNHSLALKSDGTVYAWGLNFNGQLGYDPDPSTPSVENQSDTPMQVGGLSDVTDVAAGMNHSLAVKDDGTTKSVWAWGINTFGQLGNGSTGTATDVNHVPTQVQGVGGSGSLTDVTSVAGGSLHSLALKSDGTVYGWGYNDSGALGDGTSTSPRTTPVQVQTRNQSGTLVPLTDVASVAAGGEHSLALKSGDGTVWAWGNNNRGQVGIGSTGSTPTNTAKQVVREGGGFLTGVTDVAAGTEHSLAVVGSHATVWTWGGNSSGQLGNGTTSTPTTPRPIPTQAIQLIGATDVAAGDFHSLAVADADTTPPVASITKAPPVNSNSPSATFEFSSNELDSTFSCRRYIVGNTAPPFSNCDTPTSYTLQDNQYTFDVRAKDVAGNFSTTPASHTWRVDTIAPNGLVNINDGARFTKSATVNLTLSAIDQSPSSGVAEMRFSNDGTSWSNWEPFAEQRPAWTLEAGDGEKSVYAQFKDAAGNESGTSQSFIVLDSTGPTLDTDNSDGSDGVTPNNGARNVSRRTNVIATFTESFEMNAATLETDSTAQAPGTFTLVNTKTGAAVDATVSCDDPCKTVTLDPSAARLAKRTTYRATITTAAEDMAGNPLDAEKSWTFKTKRR